MRSTFGTILTACALVVALWSCASTNAARSVGSAPDLITAGEITLSSATNPYELISRLRPNWLRPRGVGSLGGGVRNQVILVYLDSERVGDIASLRTLSLVGVKSLQWLDAAKAGALLPNTGSAAIGGAIVIHTR